MGVDQLKASVTAESSYTLVALAGESDMNTREVLGDVLDQAASQPARRVIVDMSALEFIDSTAMHMLMNFRASFTGQGGRLSFAAPQPLVARVLSLSGADQLVPIHPDLATALAADG